MKEFVNKNKTNIIKILILIIVVILMILTGIKLWDMLSVLSEPDGKQEFKAMIEGMGVMGWLYLLGIQILQIIIAIIPGEPVEILAGMLYGAIGGFITCEIGILLGSLIVFFGVRWLGYSVVTSFIPEEKFLQYKFLQNSSRLEAITFVLFFIPGTPKDMLTYFAGFTPIKPAKFLMISTIARIPSVLTSTVAGASIINGTPLFTILVFLITGLLAVLGIWYNKKFMQKNSDTNSEE